MVQQLQAHTPIADGTVVAFSTPLWVLVQHLQAHTPLAYGTAVARQHTPLVNSTAFASRTPL